MKVAICVITDGSGAPDHVMLERCLRSVLHQALDSSRIQGEAVLIDNGSAPSVRQLAQRLAEESTPLSLHFEAEPVLGIPFARNASVAKAIALGADLIAFIDDDEIAPPGWLSLMIHELETRDADVVQGDRQGVENAALLMRLGSEPVAPVTAARISKTGATNNTLMRRWLVADAKLRFDENMRFTGGSDGEFYMRAADAGARIVRLRGATVFELWTPERQSLKEAMARGFRIGTNFHYRQCKNRPAAVALLNLLTRSCGRLLTGSVKLGGALATIVFPRRARSLAQGGLVDWSFFAGCWAPALGITPQPYRDRG